MTPVPADWYQDVFDVLFKDITKEEGNTVWKAEFDRIKEEEKRIRKIKIDSFSFDSCHSSITDIPALLYFWRKPREGHNDNDVPFYLYIEQFYDYICFFSGCLSLSCL